MFFVLLELLLYESMSDLRQENLDFKELLFYNKKRHTEMFKIQDGVYTIFLRLKKGRGYQFPFI